MVQFVREYPALFEIGQTASAQLGDVVSVEIGLRSVAQLPVVRIPWAHNVILMQNVKDLPAGLCGI